MGIKRVLIVGGTKGLGLSLSEEYRRGGHEVVILGASCQESLSSIKCDISSSDDLFLLKTRLQREGKFDIIHLNSAVAFISKDSINFEHIYKMIDINLMGTLKVLEILISVYKGQFHIVFTSSVTSFRGYFNVADGSASKSFMSNFIESNSERFKKQGIFYSIIYPAYIETRLSNQEANQKPFIMGPDAMSKYVVRKVLKGDVSIMPQRGAFYLAKLLSLFSYEIYFKVLKYCLGK